MYLYMYMNTFIRQNSEEDRRTDTRIYVYGCSWQLLIKKYDMIMISIIQSINQSITMGVYTYLLHWSTSKMLPV